MGDASTAAGVAVGDGDGLAKDSNLKRGFLSRIVRTTRRMRIKQAAIATSASVENAPRMFRLNLFTERRTAKFWVLSFEDSRDDAGGNNPGAGTFAVVSGDEILADGPGRAGNCCYFNRPIA